MTLLFRWKAQPFASSLTSGYLLPAKAKIFELFSKIPVLSPGQYDVARAAHDAAHGLLELHFLLGI